MIEGCVADIVRQEPKGSSNSDKTLILVANAPSAMSEGYTQISSSGHGNRLVSRQHGSFKVVFEHGEEENLVQVWTDNIPLANLMTGYNGGSPNSLVQVAGGLYCLSVSLAELISAVTGIDLSFKERQMVYDLEMDQTNAKEALKGVLPSLSQDEKQKFDEEKKSLSPQDLEFLWNVYRIVLDNEGTSEE